MTDEQETNHAFARSLSNARLGRSIRRVYRKADWWFDGHLWFWIGIKTQQSANYPGGNKFLAGVHEFAWSKFCGYGWSFAWRMGCIYWRPKHNA